MPAAGYGYGYGYDSTTASDRVATASDSDERGGRLEMPCSPWVGHPGTSAAVPSPSGEEQPQEEPTQEVPD
jgi:hypothetical protein